jgi:hypothetical protein
VAAPAIIRSSLDFCGRARVAEQAQKIAIKTRHARQRRTFPMY